VTVSADGLGSLKFAGEGGDSAVAAMDDSVAGEMWDDYQASADEPTSGASSNDMLIYTLPTIVEGVDIAASYTPNGDGGADSSTSYSVEYTGIEGLTLAYGAGEDNSTTTTADATAWSISYAYGPFSASLADLEYDHETATSDRDMSSYYVSYTVSDEISIGYGVEEITDGSGTEDAEFSGYDASYTAGGMTLSVAMSKGDNIDYSTTATKDQERWFLGASFAF
jgi:outer membrane protein OmpU